MRLPKPFFRLPRRFDVEQLRAEIAGMPAHAWAPHPNGIPGNQSVRLISVNGGENDLVDGDMLATPHLARAPYVRQILASFAVPWSRTRLLKLAPHAGVPSHADINYHWFNRVRLHIPVETRPEVRFHCDGVSVHMAAGEAWVFDNWRLHHVENPTPSERIHLVADTAGSAAFWQLVGSSDDPGTPVLSIDHEIGREPRLLTECNSLRPVMNPAELELLVGNLRGELMTLADSAEVRQRLTHYHGVLDAFVRDWRQCYLIHAEKPAGRNEFINLRNAVRGASRELGEGIVMRTNRVAAHAVLEGRVLRVCVLGDPPRDVGKDGEFEPSVPSSSPQELRAPLATRALAPRTCLRRPLFIVAAPRSGSTLLFETLAASEQIATVGGEAHWLIESIDALRPGAPGVDSNRLRASHLTPPIAQNIKTQLLERLVDKHGRSLPSGSALRILEKTPKNSLRIPFLHEIFPDARFIFLWREPRGNLSSIIEAWRSGRWRTYPALEGFVLPWSLLLPPGWQDLRGRPVEEIAAFQWKTTNQIILDDLKSMSGEAWTSVEYAELVRAPEVTVRRLCAFADLDFGAGLAERVRQQLPPARHTLTPASPDKWRNNAELLAPLLPALEALHQKLETLAPQSPNR